MRRLLDRLLFPMLARVWDECAEVQADYYWDDRGPHENGPHDPPVNPYRRAGK